MTAADDRRAWEQALLAQAREHGPHASARIAYGPVITNAWLEGADPDTALVFALTARNGEQDHEAVFRIWDRGLRPRWTAGPGMPPVDVFVGDLIEWMNDPPYPRRERSGR